MTMTQRRWTLQECGAHKRQTWHDRGVCRYCQEEVEAWVASLPGGENKLLTHDVNGETSMHSEGKP